MNLQEAFDAGFEAVKAYVDQAVGGLAEQVAALQAQQGSAIADEVRRLVAGIEDLAPLIAAEVEKALSNVRKPADGIGLAGALIGRDGDLVLTLTDGSVKNLGRVVGKDVDEAAVEARIAGLVKAIPTPRDGADGLGFDDLSVLHDGEREITLRFSRGDLVKDFAFNLPVVLDRGVYREGAAYKQGDGTTFGGSFWIAQKDTDEKPGAGDGWRLAVKKGRDGKEVGAASKAALSPIAVGMPGRG